MLKLKTKSSQLDSPTSSVAVAASPDREGREDMLEVFHAFDFEIGVFAEVELAARSITVRAGARGDERFGELQTRIHEAHASSTSKQVARVRPIPPEMLAIAGSSQPRPTPA
jgi:hypothetical protein